MERLFGLSDRKIRYTSMAWKRYLFDRIDWSERLIIITGSRGAGKTTLLLQKLHELEARNTASCLYLSLDDLFFTTIKLTNVIDFYYKRGIIYFYLDEVHKYPLWSVEVKNLYDNYPDIRLAVTGSPAINMETGKADLSRRASRYHLYPLSFREYLSLEKKYYRKPLELDELINEHEIVTGNINKSLKPLKEFHSYLKLGQFPYYKDGRSKYPERLRNIINIVIDYDIQSVLNLEYITLFKLKKLLRIVSYSAPFKPNISELAKKLDINRSYIYRFFDILEHAGLILQLKHRDSGMSQLNKPEKIYLGNTNLLYALSENPEQGCIRETLFFSQLIVDNKVNYSKSSDFLINDLLTFETGDKNKGAGQLADVPDSYVVLDNIETGFRDRIPIWLFGFLY